jgi:biopolymer transport protein ExbB/TolQ
MFAFGIYEFHITIIILVLSIPEIIVYNFYAREMENLSYLYDTYRDEFNCILYNQVN